METVINQRVDAYIVQFKNDIKERVGALSLVTTASSDADREKMRELMEFVYEYPKLTFEKEDFQITKRKKTSEPSNKPAVEPSCLCIANRSDGVQCTRKKKKDSDFCGTHAKLGMVQKLANEQADTTIVHKMDVSAEEIHGIIYYIDSNNNVYNTEDVLEGKHNPKIIAKAIKHNDGSFMIPELF
jgi:hypothetical protein